MLENCIPENFDCEKPCLQMWVFSCQSSNFGKIWECKQTLQSLCLFSHFLKFDLNKVLAYLGFKFKLNILSIIFYFGYIFDTNPTYVVYFLNDKNLLA